MLRPPELGAGTTAAVGLPPRTVMSQGMGRTVRSQVEWGKGGPGGRTVEMRIGGGRDVRELVNLMPPMGAQLAAVGGAPRASEASGVGAAGEQAAKVAQLEEEVAKLRGQLGKAVALNESMWKKVVEGNLTGAGQKEEGLKVHR